MHPQTYEIQEFTSEEMQSQAFKDVGYTLLATDEAEHLYHLNRAQRRAWLSQQRKAGHK